MLAPLPLFFCPVAPADGTKPISLPLRCHEHPEFRTPLPPPSSTPVTSYSPWAAHSNPPRSTTTPWEASPHLTDAPKPPPWPDLHRNYLAGKLLSPSSPYLRPSSVQSDHPNSFPSSCCSYQARAWPPSSPRSPSPTSSSPPPPRSPWEPHLRSPSLPPKSTHRCAVSP
jgi:hypothetical protein